MIDCPYCDKQLKSYDDFDTHTLKFHPEKIGLEEFKEAKRSRLWDTAIQLTFSTYGNNGSKDKEQTLETFKFFLRELMKAE